MKRLLVVLVILMLLTTGTPVLAGQQTTPAGVDLLRGAWGGTLTAGMPTLPPGQFVDIQFNLYFNESVPSDIPGQFKASGYSLLTWEEPDKPDRAKGLLLPMMAKYTEMGNGSLAITILAMFQVPPWAPLPGTVIYKLEGDVKLSGSAVSDDTMQGRWFFKALDGTIRSNKWSVAHLDRRNVKAPEVPLNDPLLKLYVRSDAYALVRASVGANGFDGTQLGVRTNIVSAAVRVTLPTGESVIIPQYTDVFSLGVDFITNFRYHELIPGLPVLGGEYTFTLLDVLGNPIPGAFGRDIYVGGYVPQPPTNVNSLLVSNGIFLNWAPAPVIPTSFDPANGLGFYQIEVYSFAGGMVFGANQIQQPQHLIPRTSNLFGPNDYGTPLSALLDGTYGVNMHSFSVAPAGSAGFGSEAQVSISQTEHWFFDISGGAVVNLRKGTP